jgi:hypothetical protein
VLEHHGGKEDHFRLPGMESLLLRDVGCSCQYKYRMTCSVSPYEQFGFKIIIRLFIVIHYHL